MRNKGSRVSIEGPQVLLEPNSAQAIAVALHELATNAAKYRALSGPKVGWRSSGRSCSATDADAHFGQRLADRP